MSSPAVRPGGPPTAAGKGRPPPGGRRGAAAWAPVPGPGGRSTGPASRSGLWTRQKLPPHRSSQAAAVQISSRVQPVSDRAAGGPQSPAACRTRRDSREGCTPPSQSHPAGSRPRIFRRSPRRKISGLPRPFRAAACSAKRTASGSSSTPVTDSARWRWNSRRPSSPVPLPRSHTPKPRLQPGKAAQQKGVGTGLEQAVIADEGESAGAEEFPVLQVDPPIG